MATKVGPRCLSVHDRGIPIQQKLFSYLSDESPIHHNQGMQTKKHSGQLGGMGLEQMYDSSCTTVSFMDPLARECLSISCTRRLQRLTTL